MTFLARLATELGAVGIRGRRRQRILTELADHLSFDPEAELGDPLELARRFADELGTTLARRAAYRSFGALAVAGVLFAAAWLAQQGALVHALNASSTPLGDLAGVLVAVAPQVAFVAGVLGALRAWRRRNEPVIGRAEAVVVVRRAGVGLGAGLLSVGGLALMAFAQRAAMPGWWLALTWSAAAAGGLALLAAVPALVAAAPIRPVAGGTAGDLYEDFGRLVPGPLRGRPWRLAAMVAAALALGVAAAGVLQADPFDGILRGIVDGLACLAGFGLLGRFLGLR